MGAQNSVEFDGGQRDTETLAILLNIKHPCICADAGPATDLYKTPFIFNYAIDYVDSVWLWPVVMWYFWKHSA